MVFEIFSCNFVKKIENEVSACFYEITYYLWIFFSSNTLQRACSGFLIASHVSKSFFETRLWSRKLFRKPSMNVKKSTNESKGKLEQKFDASFDKIIRIIKCFKEANKNFILFFLLNWAG